VDDDHGPGSEVIGYLVEVGESYCCLLRGPASNESTDEDY
jgi:hypothetical protein